MRCMESHFYSNRVFWLLRSSSAHEGHPWFGDSRDRSNSLFNNSGQVQVITAEHGQFHLDCRPFPWGRTELTQCHCDVDVWLEEDTHAQWWLRPDHSILGQDIRPGASSKSCRTNNRRRRIKQQHGLFEHWRRENTYDLLQRPPQKTSYQVDDGISKSLAGNHHVLWLLLPSLLFVYVPSIQSWVQLNLWSQQHSFGAAISDPRRNFGQEGWAKELDQDMSSKQPRSITTYHFLFDHLQLLAMHVCDELLLPSVQLVVVSKHDPLAKVTWPTGAWRCHECLLIPHHHVWLLRHNRHRISDLKSWS